MERRERAQAFFWGPWPLVVILVLAAALRLTVTLEHRESPLFDFLRLDEVEYEEWAEEVMAGQFFRPFVPNHGPGYPWVLGLAYRLFGSSLLLARLLQIGFSLASVVLVFFIAQRLFDRKAGLVSALLFGLYWPLVVFEQRVLAESLFLFLSLGFLLWTLRAGEKEGWREWGFAGLFLGAAVITRPTALIWLLAFLVWLLFGAGREKKPRLLLSGLVFLAGALIFLAPVLLKNHSLSGRWSVVQMDSALNLYLGNNPEADGTPYARPGGTWDRIESLPVKAARITELGAQEKFYVREVTNFLWGDPAGFFSLLLTKAGLLLNHREFRATIDPEFQRGLFRVLSFPWPGFALILALALAGVPALGLSRRQQIWLIFTLAYAFAVIVTVVSSRYRLPVTAGLALLAGQGFFQLFSSLRELIREVRSEKRLKTKNTLLAPSLFLFGLVLAYLPLGPRYTPAEEWAFLGDAWLEKGKLAPARSSYETALQLDPKHPQAMLGLARLAEQNADLESAQKWLQAAVTADPDNAETHHQLGLLLWKKGALKSAYQEFLRAVECRPQWLPALMTIALFEAQNGLYDRAIFHLQTILHSWPELPEVKEALRRVEEEKAKAESEQTSSPLPPGNLSSPPTVSPGRTPP